MENRDGSFLDFFPESFKGTKRVLLCEPPDDWGGRAAVSWAQHLAGSNTYDPEIEKILEVTETLDAIYRRAGH